MGAAADHTVAVKTRSCARVLTHGRPPQSCTRYPHHQALFVELVAANTAIRHGGVVELRASQISF